MRIKIYHYYQENIYTFDYVSDGLGPSQSREIFVPEEFSFKSTDYGLVLENAFGVCLYAVDVWYAADQKTYGIRFYNS